MRQFGLLGLPLTSLLWVLSSCVTAAQQQAGLVIADVTVISPERTGPLEHAYVRILDGRIAEVSARPLAGEQEIDGAGRFLIPGLIDSHVHLAVPAGMSFTQMQELPELAAVARAQEPRSYLFFGFTAVVDLYVPGVAERIERWNALDVRPDAYYCAGAPIANGFPMNIGPADFRFRDAAYFLYDERQADQIPDSVDPREHTPEAVAARIAESDAVCVKAHYEPGNALAGRGLPTMTLETMQRLVAAAHEHGLPIVVHANRREAQAFAVAAAPDVITHTIPDAVASLTRETLDDDVIEILDGIITADIAVQPTLQPFYGALSALDEAFLDDPMVADAAPEALIAWFKTEEGGRFREQMIAGYGGAVPPLLGVAFHRGYAAVMAYLVEHDARFVFGSDTPANASYGSLHGLSSRLEMGRWIAMGVPEEQLFRALTIDNAEAFGLDDEIGTVVRGKLANLLLLGANPLTSVEAYDAIEIVFLHGRPIDREALSARNATAP